MEYDFSKIETEELREACEYFEAHGTMTCMSIDCYVCPLKEKACGCVKKPYVAINKEEKYKLFKEELNRREKMENKMPELEAGMIVELNNDKLFIVLPSTGSQPKNGLDLYNREGTDKCLRDYIHKITALYRKKEGVNYRTYFKSTDKESKKSLAKVWSKKSDKDIKIEELEKELQHLEEDHSKKVSEIRDRLQELKG